jgi:hypothetical protein
MPNALSSVAQQENLAMPLNPEELADMREQFDTDGKLSRSGIEALFAYVAKLEKALKQ